MLLPRQNLLIALAIALLVLGGIAFVLFGGAATPAETTAEDEPTAATNTQEVDLDAETVTRMGLQTVQLAATEYRPAVDGFGLVLGVDTIAQSESDLANAEGAAQNSRAALTRAQGLFQADTAISRQALEAAQRQAAADQAQLALAQRHATAAFGMHPPWQNAAQRDALFARLTSGREALIRASFPAGGVTATPQRLTARRPGGGPIWTAATAWDAPADPAIPGRSVFALVQGSDLAAGERLLVSAPQGAPAMGIVVPSDAIVLSEGRAWCYVVAEPGHFLRRVVDTARPFGNGYFIAEGFKAGDAVVTAGAAQLLARELNPSTEAD